MCIRDSVKTDAPRFSRIVVEDDGVGMSEKTLVRMIHHIGCLLYTSDAADERSSVDLGGRRIIKKKK